MFHDRQLGAVKYYGPPRPGQSFTQYQSFMELPIAAGGAVIGALLFGPIGAVAVGAGALLTARAVKNKSKTQGG